MPNLRLFQSRPAASLTVAKNDTTSERRYAVISSRTGEGEGLPILVDAETWLPMRLALRWLVYARRYAVREKTLRSDMHALRSLYDWGDRALPEGLEARLTCGAVLAHSDLLCLADDLRKPRGRGARGTAEDGATSSSGGRRAMVAIMFLKWALTPAERNERGAPPVDAHEAAAQIEAVLRPIVRLAARGVRTEPLSIEALDGIEDLLTPLADRNRAYFRPLRFRVDNPLRPSTRLRTWLMWLLALDCGLRIGEILALHADDFPTVAGVKCVMVAIRQDSVHDPRADRPRAKTLARAVPLSPRAQAALRAYLTERPPHGRRRGSPYLITSTKGRPLSGSAAGSIVAQLCGARAIVDGGAPSEERVSWHSLRHTWAEGLAAYLLAEEHQKDLIIDKLRYLGGWSVTSQMPAYYAQLAIGADARKDMAARQRRFAHHITPPGR